MQSDQPSYPVKPMISLAGQVGYRLQNAHVSIFHGLNLPQNVKSLIRPFHGVDIQPSDVCPKKFIIFDQTNNGNHVMFHPEMSSRVFHSGFGFGTSTFRAGIDRLEENDEKKVASFIKEDSADIDALLSTEDEEFDDDEVVSTARTDAICESDSSDSCSNYETLSHKSRSFFRKSYRRDYIEKKCKRVKKRAKALKGIVPGANQMNTVAALDEAVRYLRSLRAEVQKLGAGNLNQ